MKQLQGTIHIYSNSIILKKLIRYYKENSYTFILFLGIPVRMKKSPYLMHHKFFIVDSQILATGSFNWTLQAITGNWDNVIITSEKSIVEPFINEFEYIWENFSR